eukprot:sb/3460938/
MEPTKTSKQPIRTRYLGHVTSYQPIMDQYFLIRSAGAGGTDRHDQNSLFRSHDWLSSNQGPVFPDWVGSWRKYIVLYTYTAVHNSETWFERQPLLSLFTDDECGNLVNEFLAIDKSEVLTIIREPSKRKYELHSLYYQLICYISQGIPSSLEQLSDVPLLDIHSDWQPANGQLPSVGRLFNYIRNVLYMISVEDVDFTISDLLRPKKSRTFNNICQLLNFILFDNSCKSEEERKNEEVKYLRDAVKDARKSENIEDDITNKNKLLLDKKNTELRILLTEKDDHFKLNTDYVNEIMDLKATEDMLATDAEQLKDQVRKTAIYCSGVSQLVTANQNSLFKSRDWLSANQGTVFPDSCYALKVCLSELDKRDQLRKEQEEERIRLAEEKRKEEERLAEEKRKEEERVAEEARIEEERIAEEKRKEEEILAEEARLEEERQEEEKRKEEERLTEEARKEEEKKAEEERLAEEQRQEDERKLEGEQERIAEEMCARELEESEELDAEDGKMNSSDVIRKRQIRRQTYCVAPPNKFRRLSEDGERTPGTPERRDGTYTKDEEDPPVNLTYSVEKPKPVRENKTSRWIKLSCAAIQRLVSLLRWSWNSTRRSSLVFTPELLKSAKRPSAIPMGKAINEKILRRLSATYNGNVDANTPRRRRKSSHNNSLLLSPYVAMVRENEVAERSALLQTPSKAALLQTPHRIREEEEAQSHDSAWQTTQSTINFHSKTEISLDFSHSASSLADKGESFFTPCVPRMRHARAFLTPGPGGQELDFNESCSPESASEPTITRVPTPVPTPVKSEEGPSTKDEISIMLEKSMRLDKTRVADVTQLGSTGDGSEEVLMETEQKEMEATKEDQEETEQKDQGEIAPAMVESEMDKEEGIMPEVASTEEGTTFIPEEVVGTTMVDSETQVSRIDCETQTTRIELREDGKCTVVVGDKMLTDVTVVEEPVTTPSGTSEETDTKHDIQETGGTDTKGQEEACEEKEEVMSVEDNTAPVDDIPAESQEAPSEDAMSQADKGDSFFTPCVPRMRHARAFLTPGPGGQELDFNESCSPESASEPTITRVPTPVPTPVKSEEGPSAKDEISIMLEKSMRLDKTGVANVTQLGTTGDGSEEVLMETEQKEMEAAKEDQEETEQKDKEEIAPVMVEGEMDKEEGTMPEVAVTVEGTMPEVVATEMVDSETQVSRIDCETQTTRIELREDGKCTVVVGDKMLTDVTVVEEAITSTTPKDGGATEEERGGTTEKIDTKQESHDEQEACEEEVMSVEENTAAVDDIPPESQEAPAEEAMSQDDDEPATTCDDVTNDVTDQENDVTSQQAPGMCTQEDTMMLHCVSAGGGVLSATVEMNPLEQTVPIIVVGKSASAKEAGAAATKQPKLVEKKEEEVKKKESKEVKKTKNDGGYKVFVYGPTWHEAIRGREYFAASFTLERRLK